MTMRVVWCVILICGCLTAWAATREQMETPLATLARQVYEVRQQAMVGLDGKPLPNQLQVIYHYSGFCVHPNGSALAYVEHDHENQRARVLVNGMPEAWHDTLPGAPRFTGDGRLVYVAIDDGQTTVVIEGQAYGPSDKVLAIHNGYIVTDEAWVEDARSMMRSDVISMPCITLGASGRIAYVARRGERDVLVIDGRQHAAYDRIQTIVASPDGERLALQVFDGWCEQVVVDGTSLPYARAPRGIPHSAMFDFSRDGRHFAYLSREGWVIDGALVTEADAEMRAVLETFTRPDRRFGDLYAPVASEPRMLEGYQVLRELRRDFVGPVVATLVADTQPGMMRIWVNGAFTPAYRFNPVCWAPTATGIACAVRADGQEFVWADGVEGPRYAEITKLVSSADGRRLAYIATSGGDMVVVCDGVASPPYEMVEPSSLCFSQDGRRLSYQARIHSYGSRYGHPSTHYVIDGKAGPGFNYASPVIFAPTGDHWYTAHKDAEYGVVINGQAGAWYDEIYGTPAMDDTGRLRYFARRGESIYRVEEQVAH